ncbi:hypothetical protein F383_21000 [Gossypium arboreum]|uniref:Uncharacterized protein n=1 Tax=Gossypium arboreum TaxID=29729 RepID=A0A0B0NPJ2_GOSAR|nr:hypothetical protein F383_21000 [Gossypium arboreum]
MVNTHARGASSCALKMAPHTRVSSHVLGCAKPVGYTDLGHMAKLHARV